MRMARLRRCSRSPRQAHRRRRSVRLTGWSRSFARSWSKRMADGVQVLGTDAACRAFEALPIQPKPATLHPRYVAADAQRDSLLSPLHVCITSGGERWLHSLHTTTVPGTAWRDASSPYGYGGPVSTT